MTLFPYRSTITNDVAAGDATYENLFPPGKQFQARYAVQGIHSKLKDQLRDVSSSPRTQTIFADSDQSALDESFLVNSIKLLGRALLDTELLGDDASFAASLPLTAVLISAMSDFLRGMFAKFGLAVLNQLLMHSRASFFRSVERLLRRRDWVG